MSSPQKFDGRASTRSFLLLEAFLAIPLAVCVLAATREPAMWVAASIVLAAGVAVAIWFRFFRVEVDDGILKYRSLLGGTKEILLENIETTWIESGILRYRDRFRPPVRLMVLPKRGAGTAYAINLKVFEKVDVDRLLEILSHAGKVRQS